MSNDEHDRNETSRIADDLVIEGLLAYLADTDRARRGERMDRVRDAIGGASPAGLPGVAHTGTQEQTGAGSASTVRHHRRFHRLVATALAACIAAAVLVMVGVPGESQAHAGVRLALEALRSPGSRRFEVRMVAPGGPGGGGVEDAPASGSPGAVIDISGEGRVVIRHRPPPHRNWVVAGRDETGPWAIDASGEVIREHVHRYYPPWSVDDREPIVDSIDTVLEQLLDSFELTVLDAAPLELGGRAYDRVLAVRDGPHRGPTPDEVELWLDPDTGLPEAIELRGGGAPPLDRGKRGPHRGGSRSTPTIVLKRVESPELDPGWFDPEHHTGE